MKQVEKEKHIMEQQSSLSCSTNLRRKDREQESADRFNLKEWGFKAQENTIISSRRFSASYISTLRRRDQEDHNNKSFRSNFTISSTASSPGYHLKDDFDPSTYSFTTALKALQARSVYSWECMSPDGFALNSKWFEAEKYISNPLSGEVPMECLSAKTLSARSFRSRITMSAPLIYPSHTRQMPTTFLKSSSQNHHHDDLLANSSIQEIKVEGMTTRDVGTQSTPHDISSSSSPNHDSTPSNRREGEIGKSPILKSAEKQMQVVEVVKETRKKEETNKKKKMIPKKVDQKQSSGSGCLSLPSLWTRKKHHKENCQPNNHNNNNNIFFFHHIKTC